MEREILESVGVQGIDRHLGGGVRPGSRVLVEGPPGTGKTLLAARFALEGVRNRNHVLYVSFEESVENIKKNIASLGWELEESVMDLLLMLTYNPYEFKELTEIVNQYISHYDIKRLVLDSLGGLYMYLRDPERIAETMIDLYQSLKDGECTVLATLQTGESQRVFGFERLLFDVVLSIERDEHKNGGRIVNIIKSRGMPHREEPLGLVIGNEMRTYKVGRRG